MYIGNTPMLPRVAVLSAVYPYVYREHFRFVKLIYLLHGLSLCIQGTRRCLVNTVEKPRFIPMYIGNTATLRTTYFWSAVYPYVYREHCARINKLARHIGLSLCIQGTQLILKYKSRSKRFIPMCIGNTFANFLALELTSVYPYVYREHTGTPLSTYIYSGLSLCVQGTRQALFVRVFGQNGLSLCVQGTLYNRTICPTSRSVYPYVYREHLQLS